MGVGNANCIPETVTFSKMLLMWSLFLLSPSDQEVVQRMPLSLAPLQTMTIL